MSMEVGAADHLSFDGRRLLLPDGMSVAETDRDSDVTLSLGGVVSAPRPSGDTTGAADTAALSALLGPGKALQLAQGTYYLTKNFTLYEGMTLRGAGRASDRFDTYGGTRLKLADGQNGDFLKTANFDSLVGTNANDDSGSFVTLEDLVVDANKTNQSAGRGLCIYGRGPNFHNVAVVNAHDRGVHSEWYTSGSDMEARIFGLTVANAGSDGIYWNGAHDSMLNAVIVQQCGGRGFWLGPNGGGTNITNIHCWGNSQDAAYLEAVAEIASAQFEGSPNGYYQLVVLASGTMVAAARIYGTGATGGAAESGIQIGDATHQVSGYQIGAEFEKLNGNWVNFSNDNGRAHLFAQGTLGTGARFTGTPSNRTTLSFATENTDGADFFWAHNLVFGDSRSSSLTQTGRARLLSTTDGLIEFRKQSPTPAAPSSSDRAFLYIQDNGSGKGQLCVRFPTGAVQVLSTEP